MPLITHHIQKDKRITLGTCVHLYMNCPSLKGRSGITEITGKIVESIPKCTYCYLKLFKSKDRNKTSFIGQQHEGHAPI